MAKIPNYKIGPEIWKDTAATIKITKSAQFIFRYWLGIKIINLGFWIVGVSCRIEDEDGELR